MRRCLLPALLAVVSVGCSVEESSSSSKRIVANGSSTVGPITSMMAEHFEETHPEVQVPVKITGTGSGFKAFAEGSSDISNASRKIKDSEKEACEAAGVEYVELTVAMDGISVIVNKDNDFIDAITTADLKKIWEPGSKVKTWKDVKPEWPAEEIKLYGPGRESGTFDYFTKKINGEEGATRDDYTPSGDDNLLVTGVAGDKYALGYFGFGYYAQNKDRLKLLPVSSTDTVDDAVTPSVESIQSGTYSPLGRPVFVYVNTESLKRTEVAEFLTYYLGEGQSSVSEVGCVPMSATDQKASQDALAKALEDE
ncbi:UNVERIFIED_CONTAM: hypothetical protein GTU68_027757 [Idotea baltica]|nr:hypothetical protein [Idotea baltica]